LIAEGKIINCGRTLAVGLADIKDESGRLLAHGRATYALKRS
jgi:acyl-coenzyme A thioesterase PaaI-like protein